MGICGSKEVPKAPPLPPASQPEHPVIQKQPEPQQQQKRPPTPPAAAIDASPPKPAPASSPQIQLQQDPPPPLVVLRSSPSPSPSPVKSPKPKLYGFFPGAGGCVDILCNVEDENDEGEDEGENNAATLASHLSHVKFVQGFEGDRCANVTDEQLVEMIAQTPTSVLEQVALIDVSSCDGLTEKGLAALFQACGNGKCLQALYAFPTPSCFSSISVVLSPQHLPPNLSVIYAYNSCSTNEVEDQSAVPSSPSISLLNLAAAITKRNKSSALNWTTLGACLSSVQSTITTTVEIDGKLFTEEDCYVEAVSLNKPQESGRAWYDLGVLISHLPAATDVASCPPSSGHQPQPSLSTDFDAVSKNNANGNVNGLERNGKIFTSRDCFIKSVECDSTCSYSWVGLGLDLFLQDQSQQSMLSQSDKGQGAAATASLKIAPISSSSSSSSFLWSCSSSTTTSARAPEETMTVCVTAKDCLIKSIICHDRNAFAWASLGNLLRMPSQKLKISDEARDQHDEASCARIPNLPSFPDKDEFTKIDCYVRALELDPTRIKTWNNLGAALSFASQSPPTLSHSPPPPSPSLSLLTTRTTATPPPTADSIAASPFSSVQIGGRSYSKRDCVVKSIELGAAKGSNDVANASSWLNLSAMMVSSSPEETVEIGGCSFTKKDCLIKALEINPQSKQAWKCLATLLLASLKDGSAMMSADFSNCFLNGPIKIGDKMYSQLEVLKKGTLN